jgi:predicted Zn-dependent protease
MNLGQPKRASVMLSAIVLALALSACSSLIQNEHQILLPGPLGQGANDDPVTRGHKRILAAYGGAYDNPRLEALLDKTVERLVAASERTDLKYKVTILNSPAINAFALPTGQLYVTRGVITLASDTSELASVMAHEMAHVIADHASMRADQARQAEIASRVVSDVLSDPSVGALALAKSKIALATFSRGQELEADGIGIGIATRAGFDPYGAVRFLTAMGHNADLKAGFNGADKHGVELLATHPATPERIKNAQLNARQFAAPGGGERDKDEYLSALDGMIYGEDPSEGFARGRRFLHPRLAFTFTVPEGFTIDNTAQAILAVKDGGAEALRVDRVNVPAEQTLGAYLISGWIENPDPASVRDLTIGGFAATTATAKGEEWTYRLYAVRFGADVIRFIFAAKHMTPAVDQAFRTSIESFRRLSVAEVEQAKLLRLKIVTVRPGDTVESLAQHRMAGLDHPLERFRLLNGLGLTDSVKPGDRVKVVGD